MELDLAGSDIIFTLRTALQDWIGVMSSKTLV